MSIENCFRFSSFVLILNLPLVIIQEPSNEGYAQGKFVFRFVLPVTDTAVGIIGLYHQIGQRTVRMSPFLSLKRKQAAIAQIAAMAHSMKLTSGKKQTATADVAR